MSSLLVLDQGSTATKAALLDESGRILVREEVAVESRADGEHVELDAQALLDGAVRALERCARGASPDALALACQRSTCLLWERDGGRPLTPALSWQDRREAARVEALTASAATVARLTGLRLSPHYAAPKLAGLLAAHPDLARRAENGEVVAGTLDAWLIHRLTGHPSTEPGHAGRTLLYDLEADGWSTELADLWGIPEAALPPLLPSRAPARGAEEQRAAGRREGAAAPRGDWRGVPLVAVLGDQQAALLGHGGWNAGTCAVHFGTGAFVLLGTGDRIRRHEGLLSAVLASTSAAGSGRRSSRRFQLEGTINSAGSAVDAAVECSGEDLDAWRDRALSEDGTPLLLPALAGVAAPWWRPDVSGLVAEGGEPPDGPALLTAVLAGLAQRVADIVAAMDEAGEAPRSLHTSGKLTRLSGFMQRVADATGVAVEVAREEEAGLAGLWRLTRDTAADPPAPPARRFEPRWSTAKRERERGRWRRFLMERLSL